MAFAALLSEIPSSSHCCSRFFSPLCSDYWHRRGYIGATALLSLPSLVECSRGSIYCAISAVRRCGDGDCNHHHRRRRRFITRKWRLNATTMRVLDAHVNGHLSKFAGIEIPVTCYQIIGVPDKAEKDQIVKSVMDLKNAEVEEGYTMEAVISRRDLLMDVRDKLLFEPEYAGNTKENILPKSSIRMPWAWLPGALCLLQEVGEEKLVLEIGRSALRYTDAKPHVHDLLLSMALAECAIAKAHFEKSQVSQGFEALARAQCLMRSKDSLGKMKLLSEVLLL